MASERVGGEREILMIQGQGDAKGSFGVHQKDLEGIQLGHFSGTSRLSLGSLLLSEVLCVADSFRNQGMWLERGNAEGEKRPWHWFLRRRPVSNSGDA